MIAMSEREKAQATLDAWIAEIVSEIGPDDVQAVMELLMIRHADEIPVGSAISDLLVHAACERAVQPYLDQGMSTEAAIDAAWKDLKRGAEKTRGRQHKAH